MTQDKRKAFWKALGKDPRGRVSKYTSYEKIIAEIIYKLRGKQNALVKRLKNQTYDRKKADKAYEQFIKLNSRITILARRLKGKYGNTVKLKKIEFPVMRSKRPHWKRKEEE